MDAATVAPGQGTPGTRASEGQTITASRSAPPVPVPTERPAQIGSAQKLSTTKQLLLFFLLSYILSWSTLALIRGLIPHGVAIAAVIIIAFSTGRTGLRLFWHRLTNFRAGWLYLAAAAIIILFIAGKSISSLLAGATPVGFSQAPLASVAVILLLFGGLWEEPGWSGYALPLLQGRLATHRYGIVAATFIVGVGRGIWHLPLVVVGAIPWYDAIWFTPLVFQPFITWLYNRSSGSVPLVMFFHYIFNLLFVASPVFSEANEPLYTTLYMSFGGLATLALIWMTRFKLGWRDDAAGT